MKGHEEVIALFSSIESDESWSFSECTRADTSKWTHGYHSYPAKFIPQISERLFAKFLSSQNAHVNDPFYGCGTTIVSAISQGHKASGTDINKFAHLLTKVKCTPIEPTFLDQRVTEFLSRIKRLTQTKNAPKVIIPENHQERIDYWFDETNKEQLGQILGIIHGEEDPRVRDFLLVGFSQILKLCSIWMQRSTKPTRDFNKRPAEPYHALKKHLKLMLRGNQEFYQVVPQSIRGSLDSNLQIISGDARNQPVQDESVDIIVTSSPYVTSYEYADLHQLSTIWLNLVSDLKEYRKEFIGTSRKASGNHKPRGIIANTTVNEMNPKSERMANEIASYFSDMEEVFTECYRILKPGAKCCFVIGNTRLKGVQIRNAEAFAEGIHLTGFRLDQVIKREIPSKILPQTRDEKTGRFTSSVKATSRAYPSEYIVIGLKE
ncbi:MAG: DNA methyltransferase [Candidatus Thorarchaeota archaeon]|jgi:DNA modification methylase